jgi:copper transporter 1
MLFNWQVKDTCIVFRWWHVSGPSSMLVSCIAIFLIAAGFEYIRAYSTMIESRWKEAELLLQRNGQYEESEQETQELLGQGSIVHAYQQHTR